MGHVIVSIQYIYGLWTDTCGGWTEEKQNNHEHIRWKWRQKALLIVWIFIFLLWKGLNIGKSRENGRMNPFLLLSLWQWSTHGQSWGAWVAQLVKRLTWAQVMTSLFKSLSPALALCWQLRARSLLPILCFLLFLPLPRSCSVSLCLSKIIDKNVKNCLKKNRWPILLHLSAPSPLDYSAQSRDYGEGAETEGERESQAGSTLSARSLMWGSISCTAR